MKKITFLLLFFYSIISIGQVSSGMEQEFDYGIKNNSTQTITTPPYLTTTGMDGTQGKIPSALIEKTDNKQNSLAVDGTGTKYPTVDAVNTGLALKALDSNAVHKTGEETIGLGEKYFTDNVNFTDIAVSRQAIGRAALYPNEFVIKSQLDLKANLASPTFTGTVSGIDKTMVGLTNVDNTSDVNKPISTATQTALNGKENSFAKNTAFNKNFGTAAGTVAQGNDSRILNGQTAFSWGNHASAGYALTTGSNINQSSFRTALGLGSNAYTSTAYLPLTGGTLSGVVDFNQNATFNANTLFNGDLFTDNVKPNTGNTLTLLGGGANNLQVNGVATFSSTISATSYTGSATLTGTPTAPTAPVGTTGNQIATLDYVLANRGATSGTYAPTLTNLVNCSSLTVASATYMKVGNIVNVMIYITGTITANTTSTSLNVSLPVNRSGSNSIPCGNGGIFYNTNFTAFPANVTVIAGNVARLSGMSPSAGAGAVGQLTLSFQYDVTN